jgi:hypothetical protein
MKDKRAVGIQLFATKPLKAVRLLQKSRVVGTSAAEVAQWIRAHLNLLNRTAVGELFGLPDAAAVAIMHEYIDQVRDWAHCRKCVVYRYLWRPRRAPVLAHTPAANMQTNSLPVRKPPSLTNEACELGCRSGQRRQLSNSARQHLCWMSCGGHYCARSAVA